MNFVDNTHVLKIILRIVNDVSQFYNTSRSEHLSKKSNVKKIEHLMSKYMKLSDKLKICLGLAFL